MTPIISLQDVTFTYAIGSSPALQHVTLDVPAGQVCAIIGNAGAGKSTLCALCAGFIPSFYQGEFSGRAVIDGQDVVEQPVSALVSHVGLVGSNAFSQISGARFTVYEEIGFGLENLGLPRAEMIERIEWALQALQLQEQRDRSPYELSGGQQQRLVLASTLAMRPPVLVLDEPTAQLDPPTIAGLAELLRGLANQGTTVIFAEHRLEWTASLADRVVVLDAGQVIADGTPAEVLTNPLLLERKIGWPRPALIAQRAQRSGLWPADRALPITLAQLVAGFGSGVPETRSGAEQEPIAELPISRSPGLPASPSAQPPIIAITNVRFSYPSGVEALRGISLQIGAGEKIALLGRNGAGKSTLLRHMNGLLQPSAGQVLVKGLDTRKTTVAQCARTVGIVFQDVRNQLFARSVREELRFGPRNLRYPAAQVDALVDRSMAALGLTEFADKHPYDLPPALRRLVAVGAVLSMDTEVLILDEPTAGLDNQSIALLEALADALVAQGKTIIVVSHDLDFCFEALDRVVLIQDGQLTLDTTWSDMDGQARAMLSGSVGLPLALAAADELALPDDSAVARLLAAQR